MVRITIFLLSILFGPFYAYCVELKVDAPTESPPGALVFIAIESTAADSHISVVTVPDKGRARYLKKERVIVMSVPSKEAGIYTFVISASDQKELITKVVTVNITADPQPEPDPEPKDTLTTLVRESLTKINTSNKTTQIKAVAANFQKAATISDPQEMIDRTAELNKATLAGDSQLWQTNFFTPLERYLEAEYVRDPNQDFKVMWNRIADLLSAQ